jgi:FMN phosphatase YigB (HAD superfamily)
MNIYLAEKNEPKSLPIRELIEELDKLPIYNPEINLELLAKKEYFLIDVFHTFIQPLMDRFEERTYSEEGIVGIIKEKKVRTGFREFLEYYNNLGKIIVIHSDSFFKAEFKEAAKHWAFGDHVKEYFGKEYLKQNNEKDFDKMIDKMAASKENSLVIGDGGSDIVPSINGDIDILLIPMYYLGVSNTFDYKNLIP